MQRITVSTCGTSVFTNGTRYEHIKFLHRNANKHEKEYTSSDLEIFERIIDVRREKLINAAPNEAQKLSSELNGFVAYYENGENLSEAANDIHYLLHTDTYQGLRAAELIEAWGEANDIKFQPVLINDLNTASVKEFLLGIDSLVEWCEKTLPSYRSDGYKIIFNLAGGFKSFNSHMQRLSMTYADETISIFENGNELLIF